MIENFFATPIYIQTLTDHSYIENEIESVIPNVKFANDWQPDNDTAETTFSHESPNIISACNMHITQQLLVQHIENYLQQVGQIYVPGSVEINSSWLNKFSKEQIIGFHEHGYQPNVISGVYYHRYTPGSGDIQFKSSNPFLVTFPHQTEKYSNVVNIEVEQGMILLFPNWLMHKVMPNRTNNTRISLAFNAEFRYTYQE